MCVRWLAATVLAAAGVGVAAAKLISRRRASPDDGHPAPGAAIDQDH